jgi:hypothetical protein
MEVRVCDMIACQHTLGLQAARTADMANDVLPTQHWKWADTLAGHQWRRRLILMSICRIGKQMEHRGICRC